MSNKYQIRRHSGKKNAQWRDIPTPQNFEKANQKFLRIKTSMTAGEVEFLKNGELAEKVSAACTN